MNAATTAERTRQWTGPALLSFGFRPFFLFGALYAAISIGVWVPWYLGWIGLPSDWPPIAWHAHELLFGYVPAVVAGFLLTAVPNWTGRLPVVGWQLGGLFLLWLLGRMAVATSNWLGDGLTATITLSFLTVLGAVIGREILSGRNWKNLTVLVVVATLLVAQALFQWEVNAGGYSTYGERLAIAAIVTLIALIGGRIVPSFTANWLRQRRAANLPHSFSRFDLLAVVTGVAVIAAWVAAPALETVRLPVAGLLLLASVLLFARQLRWRPFETYAEPLVAILHVGYAFVPLGFLLASLAMVVDEPAAATGALHAWTTGAIGTMTLAVMTRATLGHTGHKLTADPATVVIYLCVVFAAVLRIAAAFLPEYYGWLIMMSGVLWVMAFSGYVIIFGPLLARRRRALP